MSRSSLLALAGYATALSGLFRTIVGAGIGSLATVLEGVAVAVVLAGVLAGVVAGWLLNVVVTEPWSAPEHSHHHHHDWG